MTQRTRPLPLLSLGLAACFAASGFVTATFAQDYLGVGLQQSVFISPSGEPFRAAIGQPYPVVTWFAQADTDHDGKISHDEFMADATRYFNVLDANHDGFISNDEVTYYEKNIAPELTTIDPRIKQPPTLASDDQDMGANQGQDGPNQGKYIKQISGATQYGLIDEPEPIRAADANFDFRVSADEWVAASEQRFNILDRNGDGFITPDELPKTPAQLLDEAPMKHDKPGAAKKKHSGWW